MKGPVLIVKTGSSVPALVARRGDFDDWIIAGLGVDRDRIDVASVFEGDALPRAQDVAAIVITGSPAFVTDCAPWSDRTEAWIPSVLAASIPLLAICYGHQLLARAMGGAAGRNPNGREIGTEAIDFRQARAVDDPLLGVLPEEAPFQTTHLESVLALPPGATLLARNANDPYHAFRLGTAWGIQFHPEFDADVMTTIIEARAPDLAAEGIDAAALRASVRETPEGPLLLRRFAGLSGVLAGDEARAPGVASRSTAAEKR